LKTIALVDSSPWVGHRPTYLKIFSKALLELGNRVIAFCACPNDLDEWVSNNCPEFYNCFDSFELHDPKSDRFLPPKWRSALLTFNRWRKLAAAIKQAQAKTGYLPDLVFFTWLDSNIGSYLNCQMLEPIFPYPWSGLYFHPRYLRIPQKFGFIRHSFLDPFALLHSSRCKAVCIVDEGVAEKLQSKIKKKPVFVFPDFTDESLPEYSFSLRQEIQEKANGRKIIGIIGSLSKHKGLLLLLEAAQRSIDKDWFFIFVGQLAKDSFTEQENAEIEAVISSNLPNLFFHLERIPTESQLNAIVDVCNVLFVVYQNFPHSSNMLTKAALFNKFVVANRKFCIGERIEKFNLGIGIDENDVSQCLDTIHQLCNNTNRLTQAQETNFEEYRQLHSTAKLYEVLQSLIKTL
jgi:glycosyltransferase involved in cell wall biosynthesis